MLAAALNEKHLSEDALAIQMLALHASLKEKEFHEIYMNLRNMTVLFQSLNRHSESRVARLIASDLAMELNDPGILFAALLSLFVDYVIRGDVREAEVIWSKLGQMGVAGVVALMVQKQSVGTQAFDSAILTSAKII